MAGNDIFGAFGRRRANMTPTIPLRQQLQADAGVEPPKIGGTEPVRRVGMFGRMFGKDLPRTLQIFAAGMRDISDPSANAVNQFSANEAEQQRYAAQEMAQSRTQKIQDAETAQYDQYVSTLDPQYQSLARMDREGFLRSQMPMSAQERTRADFQERQFQETQRHNRATESRAGDGAGRVQYRPVTPQEAQIYNLPGNGAGFVMGSNGRPIRVGGGGSFSPDQRARVEIGLDPALEAVRTLDQIELRGNLPVSEWNRLTPEQRRARERSSPRNTQWGASIVDAIDGEENTSALARNWGGSDFQQATSAASAFESGMLPILSGAAVTDSEARRMIRAAIPQLGDGPQVLEQKARRRRQMLNGAAIIGGRPPPYPDEAVPSWAANYINASGNAMDDGGDIPDGLTPEEWEVMTPEERAVFQ